MPSRSDHAEKNTQLFLPLRMLLTTDEAAQYCGFRTTGAIRKAMMEGRLKPAGRRGGKGTWMWEIDELDRFLRGAPLTLGAEHPDAPPVGDPDGQNRRELDEALEE